jgi:alpha-L-fucosidase
LRRTCRGANTTGFSGESKIGKLPLETCETINNSWGFNITDRSFKSSKQIIHYLVNSAGRDANFLLNIGPMPNGKIQSEFTDTLAIVGDWVKKNGESIYNTRGSAMPPQPWGVMTVNGKTLYAHITTSPAETYIFIPQMKEKVTKAVLLNGAAVKFKQQPEGVFIYTNGLAMDPVDTIIKLTVN